MTTYSELVKKWADQLEIYTHSEAENLVNWLLEHHLGMRRVDMMHFLDEKGLPQALKSDFERLKTGEPIQYILGFGPFYGRDFIVSPATLIPRNETEELVHLIIKENPVAELAILDVGTGTGCIPITLALEMKNPRVYGIDISVEALEIADKNAKKLHATVEFSKCDILKDELNFPPLDILVSNPPYIPIREKHEMHPNVVDHEPNLALFVPDEDPLLFYRKIAQKGKNLLKPSGKIYFEINEKYGNQVVELLFQLGYQAIRLIADLNEKNRIVTGQLN